MTLSGVVQMLRDECPQPQAFIQLAHQNETGICDPWNATFSGL